MRVGTVIKIIAVIVLTFVLAVAIAIGPSLLYMIATGQFYLFPTFVNTLDDPAVRAAFDTLNSYRVALGIPPVEFIQLETPLFRAKYMYDNNVYSHYDVEGRHPIYYYTILDGGAYAAEENIALQYFGVGTSFRNVADAARDAIYRMVFKDAESDWGHRDSLLDPCNNRAAIGVAYGLSKLYLVVYMVGVWAEWIEPPHYYNGTFSFKGYVYLPPRDAFYQILIYRDVSNPEYRHRGYYKLGELYAGVVPPGYPGRYPNITTIWADRYVVRREGERWFVDVTFRFKPADNALYTVIMFANSTGVKWSPISSNGETRLRRCKIFTYTIG